MAYGSNAKPGRDKVEHVQRRLPLQEVQKQIMMMHLMRKRSVFLVARAQLKPEHFTTADQPYAMLWSALLDYWEEMGELPRETALIGELDRRIKSDPDLLSSDEIGMLDAMIARAFAMHIQEFTDRLALKFLRIFLEDYLADKTREIFQISERNPSDIFKITAKLAEEAGTFKSLASGASQQAFPQDWDKGKPPITKISTSIDFMNHFLLGGDVAGEVYGLLGPYGSCKTTLMIQLATQRAQQAQADWIISKGQAPLGIVYSFFYEGSMNEMRVRAISSLAQIDRTKLETGEPLSRTIGDLEPYERQMFADLLAENRDVFPATKRKELAQMILNRNWVPMDMTGNDPDSPGRGWGLVDEIASIIRTDQTHRHSIGQKAYVAGVYFDYVGAAVEQYCQHHNISRREDFRFHINKFGLHAKNRVALTFHCPFWCAHQLSGQANEFSPARIASHTNSSEGKGFAENLDFAFVLGAKTEESLCGIACTKERRAPAQKSLILKIDGALSTIRGTANAYVFDRNTGRIVSAADMHKVRGASAKTSYDEMIAGMQEGRGSKQSGL
jgi:hypothetical protein